MQTKTPEASFAQKELQELREEIKQFADALQLYGNGESNLSPLDMVATLKGIGQGALSCAALLKYVEIQSYPKINSIHHSVEDQRIQIRADGREVLCHCAELSRLLKRMKRNLLEIPLTEIDGLGDISQQVHAAISSITAEWEDFS